MFTIKISLPKRRPEYLVKNKMLVFSLDTANNHIFGTLEEAEAHIARYGEGMPLSVVNLSDIKANGRLRGNSAMAK